MNKGTLHLWICETVIWGLALLVFVWKCLDTDKLSIPHIKLSNILWIVGDGRKAMVSRYAKISCRSSFTILARCLIMIISSHYLVTPHCSCIVRTIRLVKQFCHIQLSSLQVYFNDCSNQVEWNLTILHNSSRLTSFIQVVIIFRRIGKIINYYERTFLPTY